MGLPSLRWWERFQGQAAEPLVRCQGRWAQVAADLALAFEVVGPGAGPPAAVVTPGGQLPREAARPLAQVLAQTAGLRVLLWDRRGTGLSSGWARVPAATLPEQEMEDLAALLDHLGVSAPVVLAGLSSGGRLSALFAAAHPARVASLILLPTGDAGGATELLAKAYYGDCAELVEAGGLEALVACRGNAYSELAAACPKARDELLSSDVADFISVMRRSETFLRSFTGEPLAGLRAQQLCQLGASSFIIHHGMLDDRIHTLEDARAVADLLPSAQLLVSDDASVLMAGLAGFARQTASEGRRS